MNSITEMRGGVVGEGLQECAADARVVFLFHLGEGVKTGRERGLMGDKTWWGATAGWWAGWMDGWMFEDSIATVDAMNDRKVCCKTPKI